MQTIITLLIISLICSAFFSGMEIAFVSSNKLLFELDKTDKKGLTTRILSIFYRHPQQYITTMLVGNNISLVVFSIQIAQLLRHSIESLVGTNIALVSLIQSLIATVIVLFFGEYLPKNVFRFSPNTWLRVFAPLLFFFYVILYPIAILSTWISAGIMRIFGVKSSTDKESITFSRVDLNYLIQENAQQDSEADKVETEMQILQNVLDFSTVKLRDCYVPRTDIVALPKTTETQVLMNTFTESGLSKIVIYNTDIDDIIGYIHVSEMFNHQTTWKEHIIQLPFVPENMAAQRLMKLFMQQKKSMAVVVDEFGGTSGIITLEDLMEEIFGDIQYEHDTAEFTAKKISDHEYVLSGRMRVDECNEQFGLHLPESEDYDTIAGLILNHSGSLLKVNEKIRIDDYTIRCLKSTANRIELVKMYC